MAAKCPYCNFEAETSWEEIAHMEQIHPDEIEKRLREAGIVRDDHRQGPDLPSYLTLRELQTVLIFAQYYAIDDHNFMNEDIPIGIHVRDRGLASKTPASWIEFSVGLRKFAIWRETSALYTVQLDGSVGDEPLHQP